jgi:hypothetical protein
MPASTDFNVSPYYDDFSESKNFHRILFRPAFAVQARELTQSQSILQNQIEKFGNHVFQQGAMVLPGQVSIDADFHAVKLTSKSASSLSTYLNSNVTGGTSGVVGFVTKVDVTDGTDPDTLYIRYTKSGTDNVKTVFDDGETITSDASGAPTAVVATTHIGSAAQVQAGTYYVDGFFVRNTTETIVLDKYTNTASYRIGFTIAESFVTASDDSSLNDNATGSSNESAPGAHRFKIELTLAKKTLSDTDDGSFIEIARVVNGKTKKLVRSTEYAVLEDNLARRTFDESGHYTLEPLKLEVREHLSSGNNRGIYTSGNGGDSTKLTIGVDPFKAYVQGYEIDSIGTAFVDVEKARDFDSENNHKTRYNLKNFVNVNNVFGQPDITFVSGDVEAFKAVSLFDTKTAVRGTALTSIGTNVPQIGRAKSRGFEYVAGSETNDIFTSNSTTIFRHYLFDIEMFTRLSIPTSVSFTTGEKVTGASNAGTGIVTSVTATKSTAVTSITASGTDIEGAFSAAVVTLANHGYVDGQQITLSGGNYQVDSSAVSTDTIYTVKNTTTNTFELYNAAGTDAVNVTAFTSGPTSTATTIMLTNVQGFFEAGEVINGASSNVTGTIQSDRYGFKAVKTSEVSEVKQLSMAGSPAYTADADLTSTYGENTELSGNITVANSSATITGSGTNFTTELRIDDQITFVNNAGDTVTGLIKFIDSNTSLTLQSAVGSSDVSTAKIITRQRGKLQNPENNRNIFKLPYTTIKTLKTTDNGLVTDTNFNVRRNFTGTLSSNGDLSITTGTNETFASLNNDDFSVTIMSTGSGGTGAVGDVLNLSGNNHEGDAIFTLSGSPTGRTLTLDFGANFNGHKVKILATVSRSVAQNKAKTLNSNETLAVSTQATIESGIIGLGKADIYNLDSIYMAPDFDTAATSSHTDITDRFELDNGQRDNYYDIGRIKLKPGKLIPSGRLLIQFDYFSHGSGDYFDVDSYAGVIDYEDIPSYTSPIDGEILELRDCLDFRPRVDDASTINSGNVDRTYDGTGASDADVVEFNSDITTDFEYYLPRIDKLFLTRQGDFKISKGASALIPEPPSNLDGHLYLARIDLPSYTLRTQDVNLTQEDTKRFTMRDIGEIERRVQNVEYYTQLSLLEADSKSLQVQDADGFDRFKNGFVVDNFSGHNVGDVSNKDYKFAVDRANGEGRGLYFSDAVELEEVDDDGTAIVEADRTAAGYQKTGDLITLPYTEETLVEVPYATATENLNPYAIFEWIGQVELDPPVDEWKDIVKIPDLTVNVRGSFDNFAFNRGIRNPNIADIPLGTEWNEWQTAWTGQTRTFNSGWNTISQTSIGETRAGVRSNAVALTVTQNIGDRVVGVNFIPFIRSRDVSFTARGMRPNTRVYGFFDNVDINAFITPTSGSLGGSIVTDANGTASGVFAIPDPNTDSNPRWRTGKRVFRLTGSSSNSADRTATATSGEGDYTARGLQETIRGVFTSTRELSVVRTNVADSRTTVRQSVSARPRPVQTGCFMPGTLMTLADGTEKKVEEIIIGDKLLGQFDTINEVKLILSPKTNGRRLTNINNKGFFVTEDHPFMTTDGWKSCNKEMSNKNYPQLDVDQLEIGDEIRGEGNKVTEVTSIEYKEVDADTDLHNFTLDGDHTYIANGFVAHNKGTDPLAQSFMIDEDNGVFVSSVEVFFATKSSTIPVRAEIRNMINGYPGQEVLPFSVKYLNPSEVNISTDGTAGTTFTFPSPVYLHEDTEYCVILYSDSFDYTAYICKLGEKTLDSSRIVSKIPDTGILFKSSNYRTWTPFQMEDMKFKLNRCKFTTGTNGVVTLANKDLTTKTLATNPLTTFNGTGLIRVKHPNHGMLSTSDNVTIANVASGTYNNISNSDINGTYTSISNMTFDSYDITTGGTANATSEVGGTSITATQNRLYDVLQLQIGHIVHPDTTLSTSIRTTTGKSLHGSETPFSLASSDNAKTVVLSKNIYFTEPKLVASAINQTNEMSATTNFKTLLANITMNSTSDNMSPVIDVKRLTAFTIQNRVSNPSVSSTSTFTGDGSTTAFTLGATPSSAHIMQVKKNGNLLEPIDDYTVSSTTLTLATAPASNDKVVAKITNTVNFREDTDNEGASASSTYLTRPVNLANASTALEIRVDASVRVTGTIEAYFRTSGGEEVRQLKDIGYTAFNSTGAPDTAVTPSEGNNVQDSSFNEHKFSVSDLPEFSSFQIKLVMKGTVSSYPVRIKDFRAIALAV